MMWLFFWVVASGGAGYGDQRDIAVPVGRKSRLRISWEGVTVECCRVLGSEGQARTILFECVVVVDERERLKKVESFCGQDGSL